MVKGCPALCTRGLVEGKSRLSKLRVVPAVAQSESVTVLLLTTKLAGRIANGSLEQPISSPVALSVMRTRTLGQELFSVKAMVSTPAAKLALVNVCPVIGDHEVRQFVVVLNEPLVLSEASSSSTLALPTNVMSIAVLAALIATSLKLNAVPETLVVILPKIDPAAVPVSKALNLPTVWLKPEIGSPIAKSPKVVWPLIMHAVVEQAAESVVGNQSGLTQLSTIKALAVAPISTSVLGLP